MGNAASEASDHNGPVMSIDEEPSVGDWVWRMLQLISRIFRLISVQRVGTWELLERPTKCASFSARNTLQ